MNSIDPPARRRVRIWVPLIGGVLLAAALFWVGGWLLAGWCWNRAGDDIDRGTLAQARVWLHRGERLASAPRGKLTAARLHRQFGDQVRWEAAIASLSDLELTVGDGEALRLERRLGAIRWGEKPSLADQELDRLIREGATIDDAMTTLLHRLVESGATDRAETLIERWSGTTPSTAQLAWARGLLHDHLGNHTAARAHFEQALSIEPDHDNARLGLARTAEQLGDFELAAERFAEHLSRWPDSEAATLGLSRCSRSLAQVELAEELMRRLLARRAIDDEPSREVWLEAAEVAFLAGDYEEAIRRFEMTDLEAAQLAGTVRTAATVSGLSGRPEQARSLFNRYLEGHHLTFRREILESRVREDPSDQPALEGLRQILSGQYVSPGFPEQSEQTVSPLFSRHCAACHGESGRGDGPANRHLWPPSRDLVGDRYRLVTTTNQFPSPDDIRAVIRRGIPGTAMPAFGELSDGELDALVDQTYRLRQQGFRSQLIDSFRAFDEPVQESWVTEVMGRSGTAGPALAVPDWQPVTEELLDRGREIYRKAACNGCHGEDGQGGSGLLLLDERGRPTVSRDLVADPMKGGGEGAALFARIRLGMPGSPHPASPTLSDQDLVAVVEYCLSLSREPKRHSTNYQRAQRVNQHALESFRGARR